MSCAARPRRWFGRRIRANLQSPWLRQDLTWWTKALDEGNAQINAQVRLRLRNWQTDRDLAGVHTRDALARLPEEECKQWERLWSDVGALLRRVGEPE
jgi:hypothetical protein